ncbi:hypothetical protein [Pectobacterium phage Wc4-1]|uniref:Uncharacterized protein n=2 Tax=Arnovirus TaxID=3425109 RepID=A0A5P8D658_9CAUD|nr:hypothetical protein Arno162_7 [Pectobacterium phage Arno162]QFP93799.1 hypothetical protein [Pectobacterium phage Wc4]QFP93944.1 hypothetical protein [Pectobacterium phage Wc4-1]
MRQLIQTATLAEKATDIRQIIAAQDTGRVFTIVNVKQDGSLRTYRAMLKANVQTKGEKSTTAHKPNLLTVFEVDANEFRAINLETVLSLKIGTVDALFIDTETGSRIKDESIRKYIVSAASMATGSFAVVGKVLGI